MHALTTRTFFLSSGDLAETDFRVLDRRLRLSSHALLDPAVTEQARSTAH
jgi:hypothetical protein